MAFGWQIPYTRPAPPNIGNVDVIYPIGDRPQVALLGIGGRPTRGQLTAIPGGGLVDYKTVQIGLPGLIVPTPGGSQALGLR